MTNNNSRTVLVVGANGATGRHLIDQLLKNGHLVKAVVRSPKKLAVLIQNRKRLEIIKANILDLSHEAMSVLVKDCAAIASCLGHSPNFRGVFGPPKRLVTNAVSRLCRAVVDSHGQDCAIRANEFIWCQK